MTEVKNGKLRKAIYIIRILQHFVFETKLWNITNFAMLFQPVVIFLPSIDLLRSKFWLLWVIGRLVLVKT
jgi:hypothetical protein